MRFNKTNTSNIGTATTKFKILYFCTGVPNGENAKISQTVLCFRCRTYYSLKPCYKLNKEVLYLTINSLHLIINRSHYYKAYNKKKSRTHSKYGMAGENRKKLLNISFEVSFARYQTNKVRFFWGFQWEVELCVELNYICYCYYYSTRDVSKWAVALTKCTRLRGWRSIVGPVTVATPSK